VSEGKYAYARVIDAYNAAMDSLVGPDK
jgi:hypothetical protein